MYGLQINKKLDKGVIKNRRLGITYKKQLRKSTNYYLLTYQQLNEKIKINYEVK
jgi:hypothetical protein